MSKSNLSTTVEAEILDAIEDQPEDLEESQNMQTSTIVNNLPSQGQYIHRILSEFSEFSERHTPWGIEVTMANDELSLWSVKILGPIGSPFEGGIFKGILMFNDLYPYAPPTFKFLSQMFHPNISDDGEPCLEQIYHKWTPCHSVWSLLASVQFLLNDPCTEEPINETAAFCYQNHHHTYVKMANNCVLKSIQDFLEGEKFGSQMR